MEEDFTDEEYYQYYDLKTKGLENLLGEMHDLVGHAIIPFSIGGTVDMYYFPNHIEGTGFATMELLDLGDVGPIANGLGTYELVAFTKHPYNSAMDEKTPFSRIERTVCNFLTGVGNYSFEAQLNPGETIEFPNNEEKRKICLIFDEYSPSGEKFLIGNQEHH